MAKKRPVIKMKTAEQPADTGSETGQNLANLMGSIVKESTTGKRYTGNVSQRAWDDHGKARAAHVRKTGDAPSDSQVPPPKGEFKYVEEGTEGQWDAPEPSWKDEEDSDYRVHPAGRYVGSTRAKGSRQDLDAGHPHEGHTQR